jgi:hypothetical protein
MFNHIIFLGLNFQEIFLVCILVLLLIFLGVFLTSLFRNREKVNFYSLVVRENGRISKVGTAFIFILLLLIYQVISGNEVSTYLVELLFVIFTAELGTKFIDNKFISDSKMLDIKQSLIKPDKKKQSMSAKNIDDIDFDDL